MDTKDNLGNSMVIQVNQSNTGIPDNTQVNTESTKVTTGIPKVNQGNADNNRVTKGIHKVIKDNTGNTEVIKVIKGNTGYGGVTLDYFDSRISDKTVLRLTRKLWDGITFYDLRQWGFDKAGNCYPKFGKGLCLRAEFWPQALELFRRYNVEPDGRSNMELGDQ